LRKEERASGAGLAAPAVPGGFLYGSGPTFQDFGFTFRSIPNRPRFLLETVGSDIGLTLDIVGLGLERFGRSIGLGTRGRVGAILRLAETLRRPAALIFDPGGVRGAAVLIFAGLLGGPFAGHQQAE